MILKTRFQNLATPKEVQILKAKRLQLNLAVNSFPGIPETTALAMFAGSIPFWKHKAVAILSFFAQVSLMKNYLNIRSLNNLLAGRFAYRCQSAVKLQIEQKVREREQCEVKSVIQPAAPSQGKK